MRVLLISPNTERISMVTLPAGLGLVATEARRRGHEVALFDVLEEADPVAAVQKALSAFQPDVIGLSIRNIDDQNRSLPRFLLEGARPLAEACRAYGHAPVVLGGAGFSIFPEGCLRYLGADYGIRGDGEVIFSELLECLRSGKDPSSLPGVHVRGREGSPEPSFAEDLGQLLLWDAGLPPSPGPSLRELWVPVQTRRGCPNDCSYCSTSLIQGRRIRMRPVSQVVEHLGRLAVAGYRRVYFVDNSFNIPEPYARELCAALSESRQGLEWRAILYPQGVGKELVAAMAAAGCVEVSLGFESGSPVILREMRKRFTPREVREAADRLAQAGIRRIGFLLLGGPGETRETVEESLAFAASLGLELLRVTVGIRIYPATPLHERALDEGVVMPGDDLLLPRFYLAPGLEPWIHERTAGL